MNSLNKYYLQLLEIGFLVLRQAADEGDSNWLSAELDFLHNVPSLVGETNLHRHRYFWFQERDRYLSWIENSGSDRSKSRMRTFYEPILKEMEPIVVERLGSEQ